MLSFGAVVRAPRLRSTNLLPGGDYIVRLNSSTSDTYRPAALSSNLSDP